MRQPIPREVSQEFNRLLREDPTSFLRKVFATINPGKQFKHNWHHEAIFHCLEECRAGRISRLAIAVPPRSLKTICASVAFVAFALGHNPALRFICLSYSQELSSRHARDCRAVVTSPWFLDAFPDFEIARDTENEIITTRNGGRFATSIGGTLTGRGGDFIILDDPLKPKDAHSRAARDALSEFFRGTVLTRLDDKKKGVIVVVMQRLHNDDLIGFLGQDFGFEHLFLPAIATCDETISVGEGRFHLRREGDILHDEHEPIEVLERLRRELGSDAFQAQYQQAPVPETGNMIKKEWLRYYKVAPRQEPGDQIVQSLDTAMKGEEQNDYSVWTTWLIRNNIFFLLDVCRRHCDYPSLLRLTEDLFDTFRPHAVLIEDKGSGTSLIQDLKARGKVHPIGILPQGDKRTRLSVASRMVEANQVFLPEEASWKAEFLDELLRFPQCRFDDQVDSFSQFLLWWRESSKKSAFEADFGNGPPEDPALAFLRYALGNR